jgi:hypothetical protein
MIQFNPLTKLPLLALLLAVAGSTSSWAQSYEDIRLEREARLAVLMQIDDYRVASRLNKQKRRTRFQELFSDDGAFHVLDLPMFNNVSRGASLSPNQYADLYDKCFNINNRSIDVKVNLLTYQQTPEHLEVRAYVTKSFKGSTTGDQWEFEAPIFNRELEMIWLCENHNDVLRFWRGDKEVNNAELEFRLKQVEWHDAQQGKYVTLVDENDLRAESCGELVVVPGKSTGLVIYVSDSPILVIRDSTGTLADTKIEANEFDVVGGPVEVLQATSFESTAERKPWSLSISAGPSKSTLGRLDSDYSEIHAVSSDFFGASIDAKIGFALVQSHDMIFEVYLGTELAARQHRLTANQVFFEEPEVDPDNFTYVRQTYGSQWTESLSEKLGDVTFGLRYLKRREKWSQHDIMRYLGCSVGINQSVISATSFANSASVIRQGFYEDLYGITIDENGIYDFGAYSASGSSANASWSSASCISIHPIYARKRKSTSPWITWLQVGPSLHIRSGLPSESGPFISNSQLRSAFLESNQFSFVNLDLRFGVRKRIGWKTIDPCIQQQ